MMGIQNLSIPVNIDLAQFIGYFKQLSPVSKAIIFAELKKSMMISKSTTFSLKGTVLSYVAPFDPVSENDWEATL